MQILQTIWNALTIENETILILTGIPMIFLEVILSLLIFRHLLNIKCSRTQSVLYVVSFSTVAVIATYLIPTPYNTFINLMAMPVLIYFILKTNALKAIIAEITFYITIFCVGSPVVAFYTAIFNAPSNILFNIPIHKMLYSTILYTALFGLYKLLKIFNLHIKFFDKFDSSNSNILIINFIVGIVAIAIQAYTQYMYIDFIPTMLILLSLIVLLIYFFISLYSLYRTNKLEETKQSLEQQKQYNENLTTLHDNIRGFKHDFNNIVQTFGGYLSTNNIDGLKVYYNDLLEECQINNNLSFLNPEIINNPVIYSLLCDKYSRATELNIKLNLEVFTDLSNLNIKMYDLSRILGILFDNAIEAASKCDKKIVNITFRKDKSHNKDLIIIQNTYINKDVDIDKIFDKGYSSKKDNKDKNHGLGLWEVRKYLKKNTNLDLYTTKTDMFFTQQFEIYN